MVDRHEKADSPEEKAKPRRGFLALFYERDNDFNPGWLVYLFALLLGTLVVIAFIILVALSAAGLVMATTELVAVAIAPLGIILLWVFLIVAVAAVSVYAESRLTSLAQIVDSGAKAMADAAPADIRTVHRSDR